MSIDLPSIDAALGNDHPAAYGCRIEATITRNPSREAPLPVHRANQLLRINNVGLQLRDKQGPLPGVPAEDIDHASLTVDGKRHFWHHDPASSRGKSPGHRLVVCGVTGVDQSIELAASPARDEPDLDLEGRRHGADRMQRQPPQVAAFDSRNGRWGEARKLGHIALSPANPDANCSYSGPEENVVHEESLGVSAHRPVMFPVTQL
jgi:hypothetical protein